METQINYGLHPLTSLVTILVHGRTAALSISNTRVAGYGTLTGSTYGPGLFDAFDTGQLVAMKLLPKGFFTLEGSTFYFDGAPAWASTLEVYANDLSTNSFSLLGSYTLTMAATQAVTLTSSVTGHGSMSIMVVINQQSAIDMRQGLLGISIDMARV